MFFLFFCSDLEIQCVKRIHKWTLNGPCLIQIKWNGMEGNICDSKPLSCTLQATRNTTPRRGLAQNYYLHLLLFNEAML